MNNPPKSDDEDAWNLVLSETSDPEVRIRLLGFRISVLVREKEDLNRRVKKLEIAYFAGKNIFWMAPFICGVIYAFWANWEWISRPWNRLTLGK